MTAPHARTVVAATGVARDVVLATVGTLTLTATPPSLAAFDGGRLGSVSWSLMLIVGSAVAAVSVITRRPNIEFVGCCTVAVGCLVWAIAAWCQDDRTTVSVAVGLFFLWGALSAFARGLTVVLGFLDRSRHGGDRAA